MKTNETDNQHTEPTTELIADIRGRLATLPPDILEAVHDALEHQPIQNAGSLLWKAGLCLSSAELYEYRKSLFPPDSLEDPCTQEAPVLRPLVGPLPSPSPSSSSSSSSSSPSSSSSSSTDNRPLTSNLRPPTPGSVLLKDLRDVFQRYVVLPELAAETLALWVVHTYAFTLRQVTTYIGVVSPEKRCGKTTLLELLGRLANRSLTAANISPSAMFRVIEQTQPTLLIDEADTFLEGRDELAGILNAGYRKGNSYVVRVADRKKVGRGVSEVARGVPAEPSPPPEFAEWTPDLCPATSDLRPPASDLVRYSCWCPKVMAAIGRLPDTLADRCIVITMQRKMPGEKCERMRDLNAPEYRLRCAEFVREHSQAIAQARPEPAPGLNDRAADIWEPLLAIADLAGSEWPQLARAAAQKLSLQDDELTLLGYFLKDLRNLMVLKNVDRMSCRDIVKALNPMHDRPWEDLRRGREINEWWPGRLLAGLGIHSRPMRVNDTVAKGYTLADIDAAFRRYVPNADMHCAPAPDPNPRHATFLASADKTVAQLDQLIEQLLGGRK